jgi:hypothetical protein
MDSINRVACRKQPLIVRLVESLSFLAGTRNKYIHSSITLEMYGFREAGGIGSLEVD